MKDRHLGALSRAANPGRDREAERLQHQRRRLRHHAVAKEPDAPFLGPDDPGPTPFAIGLSRLIARHVAMQPQHMHDHVFGHHRIAARRFDLAEWCLGQPRVIDKGLHPGRAAEHRLQLRKFGQEVEIRTHEGEVFDLPHLPCLRPDADFEIGDPFRECVAPQLRVADIFVEIHDEQRHLPS